MIKTFADKEAEKIWTGTRSKKLPTDIQRAILRKLIALNAATDITQLRIPPSNQLKTLGGTDHWSLRINQQWRLCFRWDGHDASDVEVVDYH